MALFEETPCSHGEVNPHWLDARYPINRKPDCPGGSRVEVTLLAAVHAAVSSGTIEGEVVEAGYSDGESVPSIPVTHRGPFLVIPVSKDTT